MSLESFLNYCASCSIIEGSRGRESILLTYTLGRGPTFLWLVVTCAGGASSVRERCAVNDGARLMGS